MMLGVLFCSCNTPNEPPTEKGIVYTIKWLLDYPEYPNYNFMAHIYEYTCDDAVNTRQVDDITYGKISVFTAKKGVTRIKIVFIITDMSSGFSVSKWIDKVYDITQSKEIIIDKHTPVSESEPQ